MKTLPTLCLSLGLAALTACERKPQVTPEVADALAFAAALEKRLGGPGGAAAFAAEVGGMFRPALGDHRSPDTLDPTTLVTEADVVAAVRHVGANGDPANGVKVRIERALDEFASYGGRGKQVCKIGWDAIAGDGSPRASGTLEVVVLGAPMYELMQRAGGEPLAALGTNAFVLEGTPYVRIGDLALTVGTTSCGRDLSVEVLRRAAARARG